MKVKKPLLLVLLVLAVLAVALSLPAATFGKAAGPNDNKSLNWVSSGENSNQYFRDIDYQSGHSVLVKELSDHSLVGHMTIHNVKPPEGTFFTTVLSADDPFDGTLDAFYVDPATNVKVAQFIAWFDLDGDGVLDLPVKVVLTDGGEPPKTMDTQAYYLPGATGWEPFGIGVSPTVSNVQIHLGE